MQTRCREFSHASSAKRKRGQMCKSPNYKIKEPGKNLTNVEFSIPNSEFSSEEDLDV